MSDRSLCSLSDAELEARRATVRAEILPYLDGGERLEGGFAVEGRSTPLLRQKLQALVAFERRCCADVDWRLSETPGGRLRLEVRGLEPGSTLLGSLALATRGRSWRAEKA